jgi:hypothetical protein
VDDRRRDKGNLQGMEDQEVKYIATIKVYFMGPDRDFAVQEDRIAEQQNQILDLVKRFFNLMENVSDFDQKDFIPTNFRVSVDKEIGDEVSH